MKKNKAGNTIIHHPLVALRAKYMSAILNPPSKMRSFKDMSDAEKERLRKLYGDSSSSR